MSIKDWRGNEIKVGSRIVYPGRQSSSMWVVEAVVREITEYPHPYREGVKVNGLRVTHVRNSLDPESRRGPSRTWAQLSRVDHVTVVGEATD